MSSYRVSIALNMDDYTEVAIQKLIARPSDGGLMNPDWEYTVSGKTDIRVRFAKVRQQLKEEAAMLHSANVKPIRQAKGAK